MRNPESGMFDFTTLAGGMRQDTGGIGVTECDRAALLADLETRLAAGRGFTLATLNLDHVVKIGRNEAFRKAYAAHSHVTADGNPIVWLCAMAGQSVELVPGSELVDPVAGLAAAQGVPVALLGSTEPALERAAAALVARHPGLDVAARIAPPMGFDPVGPDAADCIARLRASGAGLCFLALGAPKQEIFAAHAQAELPNMGFLSIGAGLDFLAGSQKRAPAIFRALALEWLWRLAGNPRRLFGRYAACFAILPTAIRSARRAGRARRL
jgi:N-acetylglucosaminyldiphosphoundecaprenol N-acetyl-beta-D-mannosaminyltransferase